MIDPYISPLRYPGGKASLFSFLRRTLQENGISDGIFVEPFAGGAGASLKLLVTEEVYEIHLNEKDYALFCLWDSILNSTDQLCKLIFDCKVNLDTWKRSRFVLHSYPEVEFDRLEIAFAAFFLNRTNRSGILDAGPIGGKNQVGKWKIDARFNKLELIERIQLISWYKERISISCMDATDFLKKFVRKSHYPIGDVLIYLDPPYVKEGYQLYKYFFREKDHQRLAKYLVDRLDYRWVLSYDDDPLIRRLYGKHIQRFVDFNYFANNTKVGKELLICSSSCTMPTFSADSTPSSQKVAMQY